MANLWIQGSENGRRTYAEQMEGGEEKKEKLISLETEVMSVLHIQLACRWMRCPSDLHNHNRHCTGKRAC